MKTPEVFISYRRSDSLFVTERICDHLSHSFAVARDIHFIEPGTDYRGEIGIEIGETDAVIVVIGPDWLGTTNDQGQRRLDDQRDFVRLEIESAVANQIPIIPVLVGDTDMPATAELPESIRELSFRQSVRIRPDPDFKSDMKKLAKSIGKVIRSAVPSRTLDEGIEVAQMRRYELESKYRIAKIIAVILSLVLFAMMTHIILR